MWPTGQWDWTGATGDSRLVDIEAELDAQRAETQCASERVDRFKSAADNRDTAVAETARLQAKARETELAMQAVAKLYGMVKVLQAEKEESLCVLAVLQKNSKIEKQKADDALLAARKASEKLATEHADALSHCAAQMAAQNDELISLRAQLLSLQQQQQEQQTVTVVSTLSSAPVDVRREAAAHTPTDAPAITMSSTSSETSPPQRTISITRRPPTAASTDVPAPMAAAHESTPALRNLSITRRTLAASSNAIALSASNDAAVTSTAGGDAAPQRSISITRRSLAAPAGGVSAAVADDIAVAAATTPDTAAATTVSATPTRAISITRRSAAAIAAVTAGVVPAANTPSTSTDAAAMVDADAIEAAVRAANTAAEQNLLAQLQAQAAKHQQKLAALTAQHDEAQRTHATALDALRTQLESAQQVRRVCPLSASFPVCFFPH